MSAPAVERPDTAEPEPAHGPAEVRAAIVACGTDLTVEMFDREMDNAYRDSPEALTRFLEYWWACSQVAAGRGTPQEFGLHPVAGGREATIAAWERAHPGQKFPA